MKNSKKNRIGRNYEMLPVLVKNAFKLKAERTGSAKNIYFLNGLCLQVRNSAALSLIITAFVALPLITACPRILRSIIIEPKFPEIAARIGSAFTFRLICSLIFLPIELVLLAAGMTVIYLLFADIRAEHIDEGEDIDLFGTDEYKELKETITEYLTEVRKTPDGFDRCRMYNSLDNGSVLYRLSRSSGKGALLFRTAGADVYDEAEDICIREEQTGGYEQTL